MKSRATVYYANLLHCALLYIRDNKILVDILILCKTLLSLNTCSDNVFKTFIYGKINQQKLRVIIGRSYLSENALSTTDHDTNKVTVTYLQLKYS